MQSMPMFKINHIHSSKQFIYTEMLSIPMHVKINYIHSSKQYTRKMQSIHMFKTYLIHSSKSFVYTQKMQSIPKFKMNYINSSKQYTQKVQSIPRHALNKPYPLICIQLNRLYIHRQCNSSSHA